MPEILNARITGTMLGNESHGIFTCSIYVETERFSCGFGGYTLDSYDEIRKKRVGVGFGIDFIKAILHTVGVEEWEQLKGRYVRIESGRWGNGISRIGHITKDIWFNPQELADQAKAQEK